MDLSFDYDIPYVAGFKVNVSSGEGWYTLHMWSRLDGIKKYWVVIGALVTACFAIGWIATAGGTASSAATQPAFTSTAAPSTSATDAAKQFNDLMDLSEKGNLVSSYTFSDTERVIHVTDVWYSMTVQFKKDFLAKVAMLQETMSGKHFFEVRDEHSNDKVGEVTAFSGALEVYK